MKEGDKMDYFDEITPQITSVDMFIKNFFFLLSPLYKKEHGNEQDATVQLFSSLHSTSESILILLLNRAIHDADVLLRTVMEGTIKYCYLMVGTPEERHEKYIEYKKTLTDIDLMTDHQKALEAIKVLKEFSSNSTIPFELMILPEEKLEELKNLYPARKRNEIKQRWSYQALLRSLAKTNVEYEAQLGTLSTYSQTSHLYHYDWTGLSSRQSQIMNADTENGELADIAHALRIMDNVLSMYLFRVAEYIRGNNFTSKDVSDLSIKAFSFLKDLSQKENELIETIV